MKIPHDLKIADYVTLGNLISGILSLLLSIKGMFATAALLLIAAAVFDFLDGKIARKIRTATLFGKQLDSLADAVSFGVAPIVLGYSLGLQSWYAIIIFVVFASCGVLRLARFNVTAEKDFQGLPITHSCVYGILYFFVPFNDYMLIVYLLSAVLMISTFKVKKL